MNDYGEIKKHIESSVGFAVYPSVVSTQITSDSSSLKKRKIYLLKQERIRCVSQWLQKIWKICGRKKTTEGDEGRKYVEYTLN